MTAISAVILAGGIGSRLRSVVPDLPKPMAPVRDRPFLEYQLDYWITQGISSFVLSVGYRHEAIVDYFGNRYKDAGLDYVIERVPLGTGGGLLLAIERIGSDKPFLLLNGDTYFAVDLKALSEFARENNADWCFSLFRANEQGRYMGMEVSPQGKITSLKSGTGHPGRLANGGVYWVHPRALSGSKFLPGDKISLEDDILPAAIGSGQRLFGIEFPGTFIDIGVPDDYHRAPALLA
ncbi:D-glycero-alpha-D-manno-heptose 1-phosphate guanylyltransferase [Nitrosospira sp. Nl5]|uniref:sugar phosphate nucleotidyltransferase n=1 Tax=Nitrosospira sp. Nl5 TaxID=200120 RepID=UPI000888BAF2|nr:sugar phosphate nucleotidyltransferase [Nitrosospira sp. Nl5]SCY20939.1 D-glycero-alpha-D-manno-heptose 1-phosphate guanylyltransferase [Nitrosospira sp. Nl5]